ncbi:hypothetical protein SELMODRAFT_416519 [Selaginella moellendorffii]|uniref:GDSL esterase/lipase n=1 Tax=Selaginella moellendorffii TaxID=88036 RepID=D8RZJ3_SELML|nr:GDSL esterase/lipase At1g71691 [Selaginella moellendorffii]EFJ22308.1 hypothetical protein SELMODRAFT_416519 [Selaginella moellendorffii]|eukprot:XP_002976639.1 GDSL esterase/lipase At1g71691 [Selaginella moellendorffii]
MWALVVLAFLLGMASAQIVPALFAFGDSLVDSGNNNMLPTIARANHPPYGYNFDNHAATGRFCDGKLIPDFLASLLGLPFPPPYLSAGDNITQGVSFGSASSGIGRWTGQGFVLSFANQVDGFREVQSRLVRRLGPMRAMSLISRSIFYICTANNDVNNFVLRFRTELPIDLRDGLLVEFALQLERLYRLGARKFVVVNLSAVGCIPMNQRLGRCGSAGMNAALSFNLGLASVLDSLRISMRGARIVTANMEGLMLQVKSNPHAYGFSNTVQGCCPLNQPWRWCFDGGEFCEKPSNFMFWDMVHPSQAFNSIAAHRWWNGTLEDVYPVNIRTLASI